MQRDKYFEREKEWLRVSRRVDELYPYRYPRNQGWRWRNILYKEESYIHWEPLEKPVFAGWEVWVTLSEERMRSRDAEDLLKVIDVLGLSKPQFWRHQPDIRILRVNRYKYVRCIEPLQKRNGYWVTSPFATKSISEAQYNSLGHLQKYFSVSHNAGTHWRPAYKEWDDVETELKTRSKVYKHKAFGWD